MKYSKMLNSTTSFNRGLKKIQTEFKLYVKENPKKVFQIMLILAVLSLVGNIMYYFIIRKDQVTYQQVTKSVFEQPTQSTPVGVIQQTSNYFDMKQDLEKLKSFQGRKDLTRADTLEIMRIVKKYNLYKRR